MPPRPWWWPENETWPPRHRPSGFRRRHPRGRFLWRATAFFSCLGLVLIAFCAATAAAAYQMARMLPLPAETVPLLALGVSILLIGSLLGAVLLRRVARPLEDLIVGAERIEAGDFSARVSSHGPREVRALGQAFNRMASQLETQEEQRRILLASVAHELLTPLSIVQGNLEAMLDGVHPADPDHLTSILDETRLLSRLIEDIRTLSEVESHSLQLAWESVDLAELAGELAGRFRPMADRSGVLLRLAVSTELPAIEADPLRLQQILNNLVANALRYTPSGGEVVIMAEADKPERITVSVRDSGRGISEADLPHIFEPFYRSSDSRGSGLGLSIAKSLVAAHGGEIAAHSQPGLGTTLRFTLPVAQG